MPTDWEREVRDGYAQPAAAQRMSEARGWLGLVRLRQELQAALPAPCRVLDLGGGNGVLAAWLLDRGHEVHLVDLVPELVAEADRHLAGRPGYSSAVGDATAVPLPDASVDAVLALGPYYHLLDPADRRAMLDEARRVVRPGGPVVVEFMGRHNFALWAAHHALDDEAALAAVRQVGGDGNLHNGGRSERLFVTCHTDTAEEIRSDATVAGLERVRTVALEGPFWPASVPADGPLPRPAAARLVALCRANAALDDVVNLSPHALLLAARAADPVEELDGLGR